jgi:hypothetical protein
MKIKLLKLIFPSTFCLLTFFIVVRVSATMPSSSSLNATLEYNYSFTLTPMAIGTLVGVWPRRQLLLIAPCLVPPPFSLLLHTHSYHLFLDLPIGL